MAHRPYESMIPSSPELVLKKESEAYTPDYELLCYSSSGGFRILRRSVANARCNLTITCTVDALEAAQPQPVAYTSLPREKHDRDVV